MALSKPEQYIKDVMSGKVVAGNLAKLAVKRHLADLKKKSLHISLILLLGFMLLLAWRCSSTLQVR